MDSPADLPILRSSRLLLLGYAVDTLGLHRVSLRVLEYNARAIRAYEKFGVVQEGVEREPALVDGRWYSDIMMGILEPEYRATL